MHNKLFGIFFLLLIAGFGFVQALEIEEGESFTLTDGINNEYTAVLTKVDVDSFILTLEGQEYELKEGQLKIINQGEIRDLEIFVNNILYQSFNEGKRAVLLNDFDDYNEEEANDGNYIAIQGDNDEVSFDFEITEEGKATLAIDGQKKSVNEKDVVEFGGLKFFVSEILFRDINNGDNMIELGFSEGNVVEREGRLGGSSGEGVSVCEAEGVVANGEVVTITLSKSYNVEIVFIDDDEVKFNVNGETTNLLGEDDEYELSDGTEVEVEEILVQDFSGGIQKAEFKLKSRDCSSDSADDDDDDKDDEEDSNDDDSEDGREIVCENQCSLDGKCYPIGYRDDGQYCSGNYEFTAQLTEGLSCQNSFECDSNVCVDGQCISGNLIQKVLAWLKGIFG